VYDVLPAEPGNASPADGTDDVSTTPTFSWDAADGAYGYLVQVATDAAFAHIVRTHETTDTAWTVGSGEALDSSARYWWRVVAQNPCGDSASGAGTDAIFADGFDDSATQTAPAQEFTTLPLPGDCPVDVAAAVVFSDDMENGAAGWTHGAANGSADLWTLGTAANDQWLISPSITVPSDLSTLSLKFWNQQSLKSNGDGVCGDGALVEISTNGGTVWNQLTSGVLAMPYDGTVSSGFGNPLGGKSAWCGDPRAYANTIVDVGDYIGQTIRFRFRLGHDRIVHRPDPGWAIDDVKVTGCLSTSR
jgi:hypothetical protein